MKYYNITILLNGGEMHDHRDGTKQYFNKYGKLHRENGPAFIFLNGKQWWYNGKLHREDGPACEYITGFNVYYIYGKSYSEESYWQIIQLKPFW